MLNFYSTLPIINFTFKETSNFILKITYLNCFIFSAVNFFEATEMLKVDQPTNKHLSFHELIESEEAGQLSISFLRQKSCFALSLNHQQKIQLICNEPRSRIGQLKRFIFSSEKTCTQMTGSQKLNCYFNFNFILVLQVCRLSLHGTVIF